MDGGVSAVAFCPYSESSTKQTCLVIVVLPMLLESTSDSSFGDARAMSRILPCHMFPPILFAKRSSCFPGGENDIVSSAL